ncbi:MAG: hypothetical protein IJ079_10000 [Lachnospiraceae bacterium]|nr:hypothetical protein [Lachnospiraceae bacterium]
MKTLRKVQAVLMMIVMAALPLFSNPVKVFAVGDTYTIKGYYNNDGKGKITDEAGNVVSAYSFCLDSKESVPGEGVTYTRVLLSQMEDHPYTKDHEYLAGKGFSHEVQVRLLKIMMEGDALIEYAQTLDPTEARAWIIDNGLTTSTEATMENDWNSFVKDPLQNLIWAAVHEEAEWPNYVMDSGTGGKEDNYYFKETHDYHYNSPDPMNDPYSLWSVFYKPMLEYIDNNIKDYFLDGYDAYVYLGDSFHQNMLGTAFRALYSIEIAKVDGESGYLLPDAELVIDCDDDDVDLIGVTAISNGVPVDVEYEFETEISFITGEYSILLENMPAGHYTLSERSTPPGHVKAKDIKFTIKDDGSVATSTNVKAPGKITMIDHVVRLLKVDADDGTPISDAKFVWYDLNGKDHSVTSSTEAVSIDDLEVSSSYNCTLYEVTFPDGYLPLSDTEDGFRIRVDNDGVLHLSYARNHEMVSVSGGLLTVRNQKTSVDIAKVDIADTTNYLPGAHFQIMDPNGTVVREFDTSAGEATTIKGLTVGVVYTVHETVPPDGYAVASDITFTIGADGKVTTANADDQEADGTILVRDTLTEVEITKTDITGTRELAGAILQLTGNADWDSVYAKIMTVNEHNVKKVTDSVTNNTIGIEWKSTGYKLKVPGLTAGEEYTLHETASPNGYEAAEDTTFTINADGTVNYSGTKRADDGALLIKDDRTVIRISKVDITSQKEKAGAHIQILDQDGTVIEEWDSTTEAHKVQAVLKNDAVYTLHETVAPDGYTIASDTTFMLGADGKVDTDSTDTTVTTKNGVLLVEDFMTSVKISKVDITDSKELAGAHIQILDEDGTVVEEWDSGKTAHTVKGLKTGTTYTLHETVAPDGYTIAADTTFTLDKKGNFVKSKTTTTVSDDNVLLVEDSITSVKISKVDITDKKELAGAHIQILDEDGTVVEEWDSGKTAHTVKGLKTGITYTLHETVAPAGYTVASDITFVIASDGKVTSSGTTTSDTSLLIEDSLTSVAISKKSAVNNEELPGAELKLTGNADWENVYAQFEEGDAHKIEKLTDESTGKLIGIKWISTDQELIVIGLTIGEEYVLHENGAPAGYAYSEDIRFKLEEQGTQAAVYVYNKDTEQYEKSAKVEMVDELNVGTLVITKTVDGLNVTDEERAGDLKFTVQNEDGKYLDVDGDLHDTAVEYTLSQFTKGTNGTYSLSFKNVPLGKYITTEVNPKIEGYDLESTSIVSATGIVQYHESTELKLADHYKKHHDDDEDGNKTKKAAPNTGDHTAAGIIYLMLLSGAVLLIFIKRSRKS